MTSDEITPSRPFGSERQFQIYLSGLQGQRPKLPIAAEALEREGNARMTQEARGYVAGGAGDDTMRANREAFRRWRIVPRMLRDVSRRDLSVEVLGRRLPVPLLLAPIGVQSIVHPDAEVAVARAAASVDVPFILSTASSKSMEQVAQAAGDVPRWYQLYWSSDDQLNASLVQRAERAGYQAIVVTLDTTLLSWREQDLQHAYLPFLLGQGLANYFSDPVFRQSLSEPPEANPQAAIQHFVAVFSDPAMIWPDMNTLRQHTRLPILLKGILHPDDARKAIEYGMDGIIVSNHGGRQVAGAIAALDALPAVVQAVNGALPVLFDSGIRGGSDVLKAIALGARAVLLGRPYMWGLALDGEAGVREVLQNFLADLDLALALSGYSSFQDVDTAALHKSE
ncbi:MAG TPA: alpha-hydroxy-acid oxidizing protein, partial [Ktedonobacteraceae bacterium]|nr:alpha-hydroxy-acid oxidizing protein [Ktedonobacteraceae bacterium]